MSHHIVNATYENIEQMYLQKGYKFYGQDKYHVNLCGFRNKDLTTVDQFNDFLGIAYIDQFGNKHFLIFAGTTKPGLAYLADKMVNPNGTGILIPGQYANAWTLGTHNQAKPTQHEAFVQSGPKAFKVWRDKDKDGQLDFGGPVYDDVGGLNGHRAGVNDTFKVGPYSAACQVWQDDKEHSVVVALAKRCFELYQKPFTYTLFQLQ